MDGAEVNRLFDRRHFNFSACRHHVGCRLEKAHSADFVFWALYEYQFEA